MLTPSNADFQPKVQMLMQPNWKEKWNQLKKNKIKYVHIFSWHMPVNNTVVIIKSIHTELY